MGTKKRLEFKKISISRLTKVEIQYIKGGIREGNTNNSNDCPLFEETTIPCVNTNNDCSKTLPSLPTAESKSTTINRDDHDDYA